MMFLSFLFKFGERKNEQPRYSHNTKWVSRKDNTFYMYCLVFLPFIKYANVGIVENGVLISRFSKKIIVPFSDIKSIDNCDAVRENTYHLLIRFKNKSIFGGSITFFAVNAQIENELLSLVKNANQT